MFFPEKVRNLLCFYDVNRKKWMKPFCKQPNNKEFGSTSEIVAFPLYPLWRWKEEEDATVNPEASRSQRHALPSCFSYLRLEHQVFHDSFCLMTPTRTTACFSLVDYYVIFVCLFCDLPLISRGYGRWEKTSWGVGENGGKDIVMPQAVSPLPFLLAFMGCGECHQSILTSKAHVWKGW